MARPDGHRKTEHRRRKCVEYTTRYRQRNWEAYLKYHREYMRKNSRRKKEYRRHAQENPEKNRAQYKLRNALWNGHIIRPSFCQLCNRQCKPQAHHHDYSKPLDVMWLCRPCHYAQHGKKTRVWREGDPL